MNAADSYSHLSEVLRLERDATGLLRAERDNAERGWRDASAACARMQTERDEYALKLSSCELMLTQRNAEAASAGLEAQQLQFRLDSLSATMAKSRRTLVDEHMEMKRQRDFVVRQRDALQARLDAIMLEHCPAEMTPEQTAEWAKHQRRDPWADPPQDMTIGRQGLSRLEQMADDIATQNGLPSVVERLAKNSDG